VIKLLDIRGKRLVSSDLHCLVLFLGIFYTFGALVVRITFTAPVNSFHILVFELPKQFHKQGYLLEITANFCEHVFRLRIQTLLPKTPLGFTGMLARSEICTLLHTEVLRPL
jgi:hypothetical protein